jgi:hypothetical protein
MTRVNFPLFFVFQPNGTLCDCREMLVIAICACLCDMDTCEDFAFGHTIVSTGSSVF